MSAVEPGSVQSGLVSRVRSILTRPSETWDVIDTEPATIEGLYRNYVLLLAAIPPVCTLIHMLVFGYGAFGVTFRPSPVWAIVQMVVSYVLGLAMVYVMALIIDGLAPNFGGTKDRIQAFKLAAYAPTAAWVSGVFNLVPVLGLLALIGAIYTLYILFKGLPKLMKVPEERATTYFVVVLVVAIVVSLVIFGVTGAITRMGGGMGLASAGHVSGTVSVPGAGSVDLAKLQEASKRAEVAAKQMQEGKTVPATSPDVLKGYLPDSVAGYSRTEVSASSSGAGGLQGSEAEGTYAKGDANLHLTVSDMGGAGALAGMANAFNVNASKETATGYEKVGRVDGRMTQERYDRDTKHGEYSVLVGDRFVVEASGDGVAIDDLKAAVNAVGVSRLEGLAKASY